MKRGNRRNGAARGVARAVLIEACEPRLLLSAIQPKAKKQILPANWRATPIAVTQLADPPPQAATKSTHGKKITNTKAASSTIVYGQASPGPGYTPEEVRSAYGLGTVGSSPVTFDGIQGDGSGQTIAIVDAYDDPNAATDINTFSSAFGLPLMNQGSGSPTFTKLSQTGTTSLPGVDPAGPEDETGNSTWEEEESLDIEWAHAIAPEANIILFEAVNDGIGLYTAAETAANYAGVSVVSMSFGGSEFNGETTDDSDFTTPSGHQGVTFLAAAGDTGAAVEYPAVSPNVVAVGGTNLYLNGNSYESETGWDDSGGGVSKYESQPAYQNGIVNAYSTTQRTVPDVSILASPSTGVPICDSYDYGSSTPWLGKDSENRSYEEGGTSLACPLWGGIIAVADQGRAIAGLSTLNGRTQTLPDLYELEASDFHDITSINNGTTIQDNGIGYDLNTGRGTPIANQLIPDLAGGATLDGTVYQDNNGDGVDDGSDTPVANAEVYIDFNGDGVRDGNEPTATTNSAGQYSFSGIIGTTAQVRLVSVPSGEVLETVPTFTTTYDSTTTTSGPALFPTSFSSSASNSAWTVQLNGAGTLQILVDGSVAYSVAPTAVPSLSFTFSGTGDSLTVNAANGSPIPSGGVTVNGSAAADGDSLELIGTSGNDTIAVNSGAITFNSGTINYSNMPNLSLNPDGGTDSLAVNANTVTVPAQTAGGGILARTFSSLSVAAGAVLRFEDAAADSDRTVVVVSAGGLVVSSTGTLDLNGNDMILRSGSLSAATALLASGYNGGAWNGDGIDSSAAASDASRATALGIILNSVNGTALYSTFDGQSVGTSDVLIKHTYYGDANLDGIVNGDDYSLLDNGFNTGATGWINGDFNYDGKVTTADYILADNAFNLESMAL